MLPDTEDFSADPSELFFDLAYVLAFSQIVSVLVHKPDLAHVGQMVLLFVILWFPWQQFAWTANAVAGNSRPIRVVILVATAVSVPMSASVASAYGSGGPLFAICVVLIVLLGMAAQRIGARSAPEVLQASTWWLMTNIPVMCLLLIGGVAPEPIRVWFWLAAAAGSVFSTWYAARYEWRVRPGHFAERHGLIVIIALGEIVVAIGLPVIAATEAGAIPGITIAVLAAAGTFATLMWWGYFDRFSPALEHRARAITEPLQRGRFVRTVYTWDHAPIVAGIVAIAVGLEHMALHPSEPVPIAFRLIFVGGLVLMLFGYDMAIFTAFRTWAFERTAVTVAIALVVLPDSLPGVGSLSGLSVLIIADVLMAIGLLIEHRRIERPRFSEPTAELA